MRRRVVLLAVSAAAGVLLIGHLALWVFLASWAPINGKAQLIQALERTWPVTVTIETVRYDPIRGFRLTQIRVVDRESEEAWGVIPSMRAQLDWVALLARRVRFRGRAVFEAPAQTTLAFSGRYRLRDGALVLSAQTAELPLASLSGPLMRRVPAALHEGTLRGQLHLRRPAKSLPTITGRVTGTGLAWTAGSSRIRGDLTVNGTVAPPAATEGRWSLTGLATLKRAAMDDVPLAGAITQVEGTARILGDHVEVEALSGTFLGSPWTLEGRLDWQPLRLEALASSRAELARVAETLPALSPAWEPEGEADLRMVCRGAFSPSMVLDCLAQADVRGAALTAPKLAEPLTDLAGRVTYDLLARDVASDRLTGRLRGEPFALAGTVRLGDPPALALRVEGTIPLDLARPWLGDPEAVQELGGAVRVDVEVRGAATAPQLLGKLELRELRVALAKPALRVEQLTGGVTLSRDRVEIPDAALQLNGQPLSLSAIITPPPGGWTGLRSLPRVEADIGFPQGRLQLLGSLTPEDVVLTEARLTTDATRLNVEGTLARTAGRPSALKASGLVELKELETLPFVSLPGLSSWKLRGETEVEAQLRGELSDWASAALDGRFRARALRVRGVPLDQVVGTLEQSDRVMRLRVASAQLAEGRLTGELTIDDRPATRGYLLQTDLMGLQLAALAQAIPAWRTRSMTGQASGHLLLSGQWKDRATWRGEGWVDASGERLGDVPLLEKVFQGLFGVLAERMGLEMLRRAQITEASVQWRLAEERFSTEDLRLGGRAGIEPVAVYAKGSVGLDQTLDFVIEPELSEMALLQAPTTSTIAGTVLKAAGQLDRLRRLIGRHHLTGTLKQPVYRFEFSTQEILRQLAPGPSTLLQNLFDAAR